MTTSLDYVCFVHGNVLLPSGEYAQGLHAVPKTDEGMPYVTIDREGDTLHVEAFLPANSMRGLPTLVRRDYNWAIVSFCERTPEAPKPATKK